MCRLVESIKLLDGKFHNLFYHEQRMNCAIRELFDGDVNHNLSVYLEGIQYPKEGLYKCRIVYDHRQREVEFVPYTPRLIRTLKVVTDNHIQYEHKYEDRAALDALFGKRGECDDILIIKNNLVTDTYYSNIVFKRGGDWYTPSSVLLQGTMRQYLIDHNVIRVMTITRDDITRFSSFKLINAMLGFGGEEMDISTLLMD